MGIFAKPRSWFGALPPIVRKTIAVIVVLVVAGAITWIVWWWLHPTCADGVDQVHGECVGVTDGAFHYFDGLGPVEDQIKQQNDAVVASGKPYATIALMIPMTYRAEQAADRAQVIREVRGAYAAQWQANQGDPDLRFRVVLANPGRDMGSWERVTDQLNEMTGPDNLRAVFGFNLSTDRTEQTIRKLTREYHIPVIGGPITAGSLGNDESHSNRYPGLAKVVPSNEDQVRALRTHLGDLGGSDVSLVEDFKADDIYSKDLRRAFEKTLTGTPHNLETYDSSSVLQGDFDDMVNNFCDGRKAAATVFFSGRPPELARLITAIGHRGCGEVPFTVVTVSGASTIALDPTIDWKAYAGENGKKPLTVEYATVTHQDAWTTGKPPATGGSADAIADMRKPLRNVPQDELADGRTITTYDSALTAIAAIKNRLTKKGMVPPLRSIPAAYPRLHGDEKVPGASGWICLTTAGTPYDKAVAIVRLAPGAPHIRFETLAWPEGKPPGESCAQPH